MPVAALRLPQEVWLHVLSFVSWRDRLSVRGTCRHFRQLVDASPRLWTGLSPVLTRFSRYNAPFWRSLRGRQVSSAQVRGGRRKHLKQLADWLPALTALRLDDWRGGRGLQLSSFRRLQRLAITSCSVPVESVHFLFPLREHLTQLSVCSVRLTCAPADFLSAVSQLTRLTSLLFHHDGSVAVGAEAVGGVISNLRALTCLSWETITYKTLPGDFFSPAHSADVLSLSRLELLNYDAVVTQEALRPLSRLRHLSISHLYSVPGPTCHLRTWLTALQQLSSLIVHGGHPLGAYVDVLPASLCSLTLNVDLKVEHLQAAARRLPHLQHLHLEPWSSASSFIGLLPQLFPQLRTLRIRHHGVSDVDFLQLRHLQHLHTLEILDSYYRPNPADPNWIVYGPSPDLQQLISELQRLTSHRVQVITAAAAKDPLSCNCV